MELARLTADLAVHQKLPDEPNDVGGLSAQELKAKFDEAGLAIQDYLNEVHLPQMERALAQGLEEAKGYADRKVVAVGAGDMAQAVYDTQGRREDVYEFAREEARQVLGGADRFGYTALGRARGSVRDNQTAPVVFEGPVDPRGFWQEGYFRMPQGAGAMAVTVWVRWAREHFGTCALRVKVNGAVKGEWTGPYVNDGSYVQETAVVPVEASGGDRVEVELRTQAPAGYRAAAEALYMRGEILF